LHAIVNNAGVQCQCFFDDMLSIEDYRDAMEVNAYGVIRVTKAFKQMIKRNKGRIIVCTSSSVRFPSPGLGPYTFSKAAINGYLQVIRHELRPFGVTVITIEPGIFRTPMNDIPKMMRMMNDIWAKTDRALKKEYGEYWFSRGKHFGFEPAKYWTS
uniref:Epimerase domain-containing protein n=1 Tax=Gongylonema pulchrum TaxID=637853 RepID=A0A183DZM5_9BILA